MTMPESTIAPLTLPAEVGQLGDSLSRLREFVATVANAAHLTANAIYRLQLSSDEILTNIITHGYDQADARGIITITATIADDTVTVSLDDTAVPYNPLEQPRPADLDEPLETRREGGLGVYLAVHSVDAFRYEHVDGHNKNSLVMKRTPVA